MWVLVVSGLVRVGRWGQALWFGGVEPVGQVLLEWGLETVGQGSEPAGQRRSKRWASWSVSPHGQSDLYLVWFFVCPLCCGVSVGWYERQCGSMWFRGLSVPAPVWDLVVQGVRVWCGGAGAWPCGMGDWSQRARP